MIQDIGKHFGVDIKELKIDDISGMVTGAMSSNKDVEKEMLNFWFDF